MGFRTFQTTFHHATVTHVEFPAIRLESIATSLVDLVPAVPLLQTGGAVTHVMGSSGEIEREPLNDNYLNRLENRVVQADR